MTSRWEQVLDQKPVPLIDHLVQEAGRLIAADYLRWPLELEPTPGSATPASLAADAPRPSLDEYREAIRLAGWDLGGELDAYDDYMRNRRYLERGLPESVRPRLLLLSRWLVEQLSTLGEHTEGRVNRRRKLVCLEEIAREVERKAPQA